MSDDNCPVLGLVLPCYNEEGALPITVDRLQTELKRLQEAGRISASSRIYLVDDGSSAVSLPETPLLGVLPGTGGLTRVVDKRKVRRDHADFFGTVAEGLKGKRAKNWGFVDEIIADLSAVHGRSR